MKNNDWKLKDGRVITLLKPEELESLPKDTNIISINGNKRKVYEEGKDSPDDDTRYGYTAWAIDQD